MATIVDGKRRIPFMRGMLTHYLIEQGFSFKEAYAVADRVRTAIQDKATVSSKTMRRLIRAHVKELFGDRSAGDAKFWSPTLKQVLVEDDEGSAPFSREHLSRSLVVTGVSEERAYPIAERIMVRFVQSNKTVVSRDEIRRAVLKLLQDEYGEEFAQRYRTWNWFRNREQTRPLILMIGGATGVGKTTVAVALANLLRISRVASTDEIRQVMRLMIAPDLIPALHDSSYQAWEHLTIPPPGKVDAVVYAFREQATRVAVGVKAAIDRSIEENVNLIIDGVHLLPDLVEVEPRSKQALFIRVNLYLSDPGPFVERFELRGQEASRRSQHRYIEHLDEILKIQKHILKVGKANGVPAIENNDMDETVQSLSLQIMDKLQEEAKAPRARKTSKKS